MRIFREQFGQRLAKAIQAAGLTQVKLSEKLKVSPPTVSRWVNGKDFPEDSRLPLIAKELGVDEAYFAHDAPMIMPAIPVDQMEAIKQATREAIKEEMNPNGQESELLEIFRALSPKGKDIVLTFARTALNEHPGPSPLKASK